MTAQSLGGDMGICVHLSFDMVLKASPHLRAGGGLEMTDAGGRLAPLHVDMELGPGVRLPGAICACPDV